MKTNLKHFTICNNDYDILVIQANTHLRIIVTQFHNLNVSYQIFTQANLQQVEGASFKKISQLFIFLESFKKKPQRWVLADAKNLTILKTQTEVIKIPLRLPLDGMQMSKILLLKISLPQQKIKLQQTQASKPPNGFAQMKEDIQTLKANYNTIGVKLKGIGQLFESVHQQNQANTKSIQRTNQKLAQLQEKFIKNNNSINEKIASNYKFSNEQFKRLQFEIDISQKNMLRNYSTHKQEAEKQFATIFNKLKVISETIQKYNFPKMRIDMDQINRMFELQIKINNYQFIPEQSLFRVNRKLHWINNKIIKNVEDVKDYNKMIGTKPFAQGISKFRIAANCIKNNGLLIGICTKEVKQNLESCKFNDQNMICLNSCGYIINRGTMIVSSPAKIKSNDLVKMIVNKSQGLVRWFCNDIEVAVADMGSFSKQEIYPIIGLGNFNDQVEILQKQQLKQEILHHETYAQELEKLNEKFGRSRRY